MNKKLKAALALAMCAAMSTSFVGCSLFKKDSSSSSSSSSSSTGPSGPVAPSTYTYKTYTSLSPSNWNELTYQDNNDTQIMSYLNSPFFEFDFKFDDEGEIISGDFEVEYSFATSLTDLSDGEGTKWQITIRNDGKWNDGTPIVAGDFVYTMKEQLNPLFKNYRADSFYNGSTVIKNAKNYVFQGETLEEAAVNVYGEEITDLTGLYFNAKNVAAFEYIFGTTDMTQLADYKAYFQVGDVNVYDALVGYAGENRTPMTQEIASMLASLFGANGLLGAYWGWADTEIGYFATTDSQYPEMSFDQVGISAPNDTTIVLELEQPLMLLKEDGTLSYKAAYNMASLPLVKKDLYEANKVAPVEGSTLWTSTYHSSVETTASWGPYMLTEFQAGKMYKMEKNPNWYGWNMEKYDGQYQTTHIECETIAEYNTAFMKFLKGELNGIGIDVSVAANYKNSDQAYYTPSDYVGSLQLQVSEEGLRARESAGVNKTIMLQNDFRKALSLGLNRDAYAKATTTAHLAGFGLFNSMHYYDVANGKAYRESDAAKKVLCEVYGVDYTQFADLDAAVDSINGYDLVQAKALVNRAYAKALEAGDISATDKVVLTYGASVDNESTRRYYENLKNQWTELMKGTVLEGRFELEFNASFGTAWAAAFREGAYDICQAGWTGAAWDPGYFLLAYLDPDYMYSATWDTSSEMATFTVKGVNANGEVTNNAEDSFTAKLDLYTWYQLLNDNWAAGILKDEFRVGLIADLEKAILNKYYTVPITYEFIASLISYQVDYITYEYNTFMGFGDIKYMTYNYDDIAWAEFVAANAVGGQLNYR